MKIVLDTDALAAAIKAGQIIAEQSVTCDANLAVEKIAVEICNLFPYLNDWERKNFLTQCGIY